MSSSSLLLFLAQNPKDNLFSRLCVCVYTGGATVYSCQIAYRAHPPENWINVKNKKGPFYLSFLLWAIHRSPIHSISPVFQVVFWHFFVFFGIETSAIDLVEMIWPVYRYMGHLNRSHSTILKDEKCCRVLANQLERAQSLAENELFAQLVGLFFSISVELPFFCCFCFFKFVFFVRSSSALARLYNVNIWIGRPIKAAMLFYSIRRH